jgi:hypothetical protein
MHELVDPAVLLVAVVLVHGAYTVDLWKTHGRP